MVDKKMMFDLMRGAEIPKYKPEVLKKIIIDEATKQGVPVELALAVAQQESGFNNKAVSKPNKNGSRDHGLFQLNDKYHKLKNVYDPIENTRYAIGMLKKGLAKNNGDVAKTLSDYNAGANAKGDARKAGDAYAQKVIAIANKNVGLPQSTVTGAAAPVPDAGVDVADTMAQLVQDGLTQGEKIAEKYIKDAKLDTKLYEDIRKRKQDEIKAATDEIKNLPLSASAQDVQNIMQRYQQARQDMKDLYTTAMAGVQSGIGANNIDNYYNKLASADEQRLQRMQAANPYTRIGQMAPLKVDEDAYVKAAQLTNYGLANANALNPQSFTPRDFQAEQMRVAQARQLAQLAAQTGLTPEQFIQGGLMDYNNMGTTFNNQQQVMGNLIQAAYQGDRQAQQILANMQIGLGNNIATNANQEQAAINQANADALARAQFAAENARWATQQGQNLDALPIQSDAAFQQNRLNQVVNTVNQGSQLGANAANNYLNYNAMLQRAAASQQPEVQDPYKAVKDFNTMRLNALGMSPNVTPTMLQNALNEARSQFALANPSSAGILDPKSPSSNYTQFNPTNQNTFISQQK
jgi:hypothetical protein